MKALMSKMQKKLTGQRFEMLPLDYVVEPGFAAAAANVILTLTRQAIDGRSRWPFSRLSSRHSLESRELAREKWHDARSSHPAVVAR